MSKGRALVCLLFTASAFTSITYAATQDRIAGDLNTGQRVRISGNMPGFVRAEGDLGRADGSRVIDGVSLNFRLSPAQQKDLDQFLAELGDRSSPNFHKYLTIPQYAQRFGMSQNDIKKVVDWLQSQGFSNIHVTPTRNKVSFDGTVAQIESLFAIEMHNYLVNGEVHLANAMNPSVPAAMSASVLHIGHLNDLAPKPRAKVRPNFTSYVSGNHFLTPADFATIYDLNSLYSAGTDGTGQNIVIVGQSTVAPSDLANFRSAAGLPTSSVNMKLMEGTATRCSGDEGESDLDLEWSGGVAKGASITFLYAGLDLASNPPDTCASRFFNVWDALEDALTGTTTGTPGSPIAPFVSTSYGFCEQGLQSQDPGFAATIRTWVQTGQTLGVTLVSASGDAGAADCDSSSSTSATQGLAVDVPASIPETTGAGGNEFSADSPTNLTNNPPGGDPPYWAAAGTTTDTLSSALEYIPEEAWNDTTFNLAHSAGIAASGGGVSTLFSAPSWQNVTGVPSGTTMRLVPDIALSASADHDPYLFCSEDDQQTGGIVSTCTAGFRTGTGGSLTAVGGTSAVAPTFTAIMALINQYAGNTPPTGLAPINPTLYSLYPNNATSGAFNDITSGNNIVPCTSGTAGCPTAAPFQYGFSTGTGYDEVTGLGSVNGFHLAQAWAATLSNFSLSALALNPTSIAAGNSTSTTVTVTPNNGFNKTVTLTCSGLPTGATCSAASVSGGSGTAQVTIQTLPTTPAGTSTVTIKGASGAVTSSTTVSLIVTATGESFTLTPSPSVTTLSVTQGQTTTAVNLGVTSTGSPSFVVSSGTGTQTVVPVTYTCSGLPSESTCLFNGSANQNTITTSATSVTLTIQTTAPTARLQRPLDHAPRIFYAVLLPGLLGIMLTVGSRKRALGGIRVLGLITVLGFSTLWMASCGGSSNSSNKNPGTPVGSSTVTVNATTGSGGPSSSVQFTLTVSAAP